MNSPFSPVNWSKLRYCKCKKSQNFEKTFLLLFLDILRLFDDFPKYPKNQKICFFRKKQINEKKSSEIVFTFFL